MFGKEEPSYHKEGSYEAYRLELSFFKAATLRTLPGVVSYCAETVAHTA